MFFFKFFIVLSTTVQAVKLLRLSSTVSCSMGKSTIVGAFGRSKFEIHDSFQKRRDKQHKN